MFTGIKYLAPSSIQKNNHEPQTFYCATSIFASGLLAGTPTLAAEADFPVVRTPCGKRRFTSQAVEAEISRVKATVGNRELAWMFENCFPNTLDTTVDFTIADGRPDTYVITGDIDAMWLRDSTCQVWPYLPLMKADDKLWQLIAGVINRQTRCILKDPYANAFYKDENKVSEWKSDLTEMKPGVHERKWEIDSLCFPIRLAYRYWKTSGDTAPFDAAWQKAIGLTLKTFRQQQRKTGRGPYHFQRRTTTPTDSLPGGGYGRPVKPVGLICSMFRPSDDSTVFPFLVPANFFAVVSLRQAAEMLEAIAKDRARRPNVAALADEVEAALQAICRCRSAAIRQDLCLRSGRLRQLVLRGRQQRAGPALVALLRRCGGDDPIYQNTRRMLLSDANAYYCKGGAGEGPGGPHAGLDMIWPLGVIIRGVTSTDDAEIRLCLETLEDARRHGVHARGVQQGRRPAIHEVMVRLGEHGVW